MSTHLPTTCSYIFHSNMTDIPADQISAVEAMQDCIADLRKF